MALRRSHLWLFSLCLAFACGGIRGETARIEPGGNGVALAARVDAAPARQPASPQARPPMPAPVVLPTPPTAAALATPEDEAARLAREYSLHGVSFHVLSQVFSAASDTALVSGYFRRGGLLRAKPGVRGKGCDTLWHQIMGGGFVCAGRGFLIGKTPQSFSPSPGLPRMNDDLPYAYGKTLAGELPQYFRIPSVEQEREVSAAVALQSVATRAQSERIPNKSAETSVLTKTLETKGAAAQPPVSPTLPFPDLVRMLMQPGFYVSIDGREVAEGERELIRTVRGAYVRAEAITEVSVPALTGTHLSAETPFPLGLVYRPNTPSYRRDPMSGTLLRAEPLALMQSFALGKESVLQAGRRYRVTRDGLFVPEDALRVVTRAQRPPLVNARARWIDIQLSTQTLVAYEGNTPVFATLVSTGKEGHETPTGIFRIQGKHVSTTMDGEDGTDEAYSIEDVPWTMYFSGSIALHAAFWHKSFGRVRSHGCVNLAPADARFLFQWTTPGLPAGFHGVISTRADLGTFVVVNP